MSTPETQITEVGQKSPPFSAKVLAKISHLESAETIPETDNEQFAQLSEAEMIEMVLEGSNEYEYVDGRLEKRAMTGTKHSGVATRLGIKIGNYLETHTLGEVYIEGTFGTTGKNRRIADVAFVSWERFPEEGETLQPWEIAPDLAIEVISPGDLYYDVFKKLYEYFAAGVREVWLIDTERETVTVFDTPTNPVVFTDELINQKVLPNFSLKLSEIFSSPKKK